MRMPGGLGEVRLTHNFSSLLLHTGKQITISRLPRGKDSSREGDTWSLGTGACR